MKNFDWSKVTVAQLREVPQTVVAPYKVLVSHTGLSAALKREFSSDTVALFADHCWYTCFGQARNSCPALACIDRIANYLTIHGGE